MRGGPSSALGFAGNTATNIGLQVLPGASESVMGTYAGGMSLMRMGMPRLGAGLMTSAETGGPAAVAGGLAGIPTGYAYENLARQHGMGDTASRGVGTGAAVLTGALAGATIVLALATAPVSGPVLIGAAVIGGLSAGFGYLTSHF